MIREWREIQTGKTRKGGVGWGCSSEGVERLRMVGVGWWWWWWGGGGVGRP